MKREHDPYWCKNCRRNPADHGTRCSECAELVRIAAAKQREYRRRNGLCVSCGKPAVEGRRSCQRHLDYYADRWWRQNRTGRDLTEDRARDAVARHGSISAAAEALGVTWTAIKSAIDPEYGERSRKANLARVTNKLQDTEYRARANKQKRTKAKERYHADPEYRSKRKAASAENSEKIRKDPERRRSRQEYQSKYDKDRRRKD